MSAAADAVMHSCCQLVSPAKSAGLLLSEQGVLNRLAHVALLAWSGCLCLKNIPHCGVGPMLFIMCAGLQGSSDCLVLGGCESVMG